MWTIKKMLEWSRKYFEDNHIENPLLDAQILLGQVLNMTKVDLIIQSMRPLDDSELAAYKKLVIKRVKEHQPIAYILGHKDFWSLDLDVSPDVLIPRPDTECLVEQVLAFAKSRLEHKPLPWPELDEENLSYNPVDDRQAYYEEVSRTEELERKADEWLESKESQLDEMNLDQARESFEKDVIECGKNLENSTEVVEIYEDKLTIVDIGTGSGAIILALASELKNKAQYTAVDISKAALDIAKHNAEKLDLDIKFVESDLCQNLSREWDVIVSNPPYISASEMDELSAEVRCEPDLALRGGQDGLEVYRRLIPQAMEKLNPGGGLFVEIGFKQSESVKEIFKQAGFEQIRVFKDYGRRPRIIFGLRK